MSLINANVIIIGGSSGMGLATAALLKEQGGNVTIVGRSREKLQQAVQQLGDVRTVVADVAVETDVQAIFNNVERIDHVFIPAGRPLFGNILETDFAIFRDDVDQRFWGLLYVIRLAVPKMEQGSLTFLTGQYASRPAAGAVVTSAIQAAVETLAMGLAVELQPIRVNAVAPGAIETPFVGDYLREVKQWASDKLPVRRIGLAEEVAQAVLLLMTNGFITGEVLHIDGGGRLI